MRKHGWRTPEWKLIVALEPDFHFKPPVELYRLTDDPEELHNLADELPDVVAFLRERMEGWIDERTSTTRLPAPILTQGDWHATPGWGRSPPRSRPTTRCTSAIPARRSGCRLGTATSEGLPDGVTGNCPGARRGGVGPAMKRVELAYGRDGLSVEVPDHAQVVRPRPVAGVGDERAALEAALADPVGTPPLARLAAGKRRVVVTHSDITRATPNDRILPVLLRALERGRGEARRHHP